jgi:ABC-type antimicrobial peptide transport system permease subunit
LATGGVLGCGLNRALAAVATESPGVPLVSVLVVVAVLASCAVAATLIPAWRAARINPADVMRSE